MSKRSIQLPGQSRSTACLTKGCHRLNGHRGDHRATLTAKPSVKPVGVRPEVEAAIADVEAKLRESGVTAKVEQARKARRPKVVVIPMADYRRVIAAGIKVRRSRGYYVSSKPSARLA